MVLSVRYPSRESIDIALASEVRLKSREVSVALIDMFDGTVFHTIFSADEYGLPTD
jgi:ethanolamine utilization microcompartment shell protein EutS